MTNDLKWLMVSDVHFPRHDPRKVELSSCLILFAIKHHNELSQRENNSI